MFLHSPGRKATLILTNASLQSASRYLVFLEYIRTTPTRRWLDVRKPILTCALIIDVDHKKEENNSYVWYNKNSTITFSYWISVLPLGIKFLWRWSQGHIQTRMLWLLSFPSVLPARSWLMFLFLRWRVENRTWSSLLSEWRFRKYTVGHK